LKGNAPLHILQGTKTFSRFRAEVKAFKVGAKEIDSFLKDAFLRALDERVEREQRTGRTDLRTRFRNLARAFRYARSNISEDERRERRSVVADLRAILAASCVRALEPDLIVLDEFQRFKNLLDPGRSSSAGEDDPSR